jgi:DNA adenine methylase
MQAVLLPETPTIVNVASVPQRSPFRYPGGKTWFIPYLRQWLHSFRKRPVVFVEPFAGGGIASLTVAMEDLADRVIMAELDSNVAAVWRVVLSAASTDLIRRIRRFEISRPAVVTELCKEQKNDVDVAFQTLLRNRVQRGGILAPGASLMKNGENNVGVGSRWYPETLAKRIAAINATRNKIEFLHKDAFDVIPKYLRDKSAAFFVDPPYTAGGKSAGKRLYLHSTINHDSLFDLFETVAGEVLLTYDDAKEVRDLAVAHGFFIQKIPMKTTHHARTYELAITNRPVAAATASETLRLLEQPCVYRVRSIKRRTKSDSKSIPDNQSKG